MTQVISIASAKGGVGKTTTTVNLGAALATLKYRVLLIDLDPERHLSNSLGAPSNTKHSIATLISAVLNDIDIVDLLPKCIIQAGALAYIPSTHILAGTASQLSVLQNAAQTYSDNAVIKCEYVLRHIVQILAAQYDYIIIDCGRSLDLLTINALAASQKVIIPVQAHYLPEEGLGSFIETVQRIKANLNPVLDVGGILLTMYQGATNLCKSVQEDIIERFGTEYHVFSEPINHSIRVAEAPAFKQSIFDYAPKIQAAQGYAAMAKELIANG